MPPPFEVAKLWLITVSYRLSYPVGTYIPPPNSAELPSIIEDYPIIIFVFSPEIPPPV